MTPGKFLRLIWPSEGFYCIAHPFRPPNSTVTVYRHKVFPTISEAVTYVHEQQNIADTYFAVLSLREERVWDPDKVDYKTGQKGAWATRKQENMLASKVSFFDLDVGDDPGKYPTQRDALEALREFLETTCLPQPTLVSSGGGVHVYWHWSETLPTDEWRTIAWNMRQLAETLKLKVDPMRTTDSSSVLRVPETYNWKDRNNPRKVEVLQEGAITPVADFRKLLSDAAIRAGVVVTDAPAPRAPQMLDADGFKPQHFDDNFGPPPTLEELGDACGQMREIFRSYTRPDHPHYGKLDNTAWYRGMLSLVKRVEDGDNWCRKLTAMHPRTNADIEAKLLQLEQYPPPRCQSLRDYLPWKDAPCQGCKFLHDPSVPNPLAAARKHVPAAPPVVQFVAPGLGVLAATVPNPPKPYERLKAGGVAMTRKDKDGNESTSVIYPYDLFPLKRLVNEAAKTEQQIWRVTLPRAGARDFLIDADTLYDSRKFTSALAHSGLYPNRADINALQDYMTAYINQLQKEHDADDQVTHLGWSDEHRRFALPDKTFTADGRVTPTSLTDSAERAVEFIRKVGDGTTQRQLLHFYNRPEYIANQFVVLASLASIIFDMTGQHGIVVNCSGDPGASKSTTLYTAASLWGDPLLWPLNGTNRGATANARMQRIGTNANLPTCVDEITHMPNKDSIDLVMGISQPGHRLRLSTDGSERKGGSEYKSAIMISTANSSLHTALSSDNAAGTAGSMRVFEIRFAAQSVHTKAEADEFLRQLRLHYGHIGEQFVHFVITHYAKVAARVHQIMRDIDTAANITSAERFWSAVIAAVVVSGEIAQALHLLPYDPEAIKAWAVTRQIPYMRGVVREEYREPLTILLDYIAERHGNIIVVDRVTAVGLNSAGAGKVTDSAWVKVTPHGALLGHYDMRAGSMHLLKQGFKEYCVRVGANSTRILEELSQPRAVGAGMPRRIITDRQARRVLGAGTEHAKGQQWCFVVDMTHPEVAGAGASLVATGGESTSPPAGNLSVVK